MLAMRVRHAGDAGIDVRSAEFLSLALPNKRPPCYVYPSHE
jgi:hypothetical protein